MATDLEQLRAQAAPREESLCLHFSRRLESTFGFVMYGILWCWLGGAAAMLPALGVMLALNASMTPAQRAGASWVGLALIGTWLFGFAIAMWLFARWVRGKRARASALIREGTFADATPGELTHFSIKGTQMTRAPLRFDAGGAQASATLTLPGHVESLGIVPVLYTPGYANCAAFPLGGELLPIRWRS